MIATVPVVTAPQQPSSACGVHGMFETKGWEILEQAGCVQVQWGELPAVVPKASFNLSLNLVMMLCRSVPCVCPAWP